ncbi:MAG: insulinase family protein [Lachnospiraceae bacterium]|nr:insulinase family protein [Lachnospiraceae bacterium]
MRNDEKEIEKKIRELKNYEVQEAREMKDLDSFGYLLCHKKTGAKIVLLSNEDDNKVFYIGFRTPPADSTGVAHIVEHTVLCGSKNFPVKDPFIELAKGSLNTFLNAMTYSDKTVYPVASCNDKDFQNLIHVYLDAVFYPAIYQEEKIFQQEGWHYELENAQDELSINGVVYNEMKGAFSSPDDVLDREVFNSLFPDTAYGTESGGDPDVIPSLTYQAFLDFHKSYYHPSNSYLYLYGKMDMVEKLEFIDREYLSGFDALEIDSAIQLQQPFDAPREIQKEYSITEGEQEKDNTYLSYNTLVGDILDRKLYLAFQILDYALCSAPGAPLKQALTEKGIGKEIYSTYDNGILQPYFSIVAKNANLSQKEEFIRTIQEVLAEQIQKGIDKKALKAGLNYFEFKYREADFGSYPKGLILGLQVLDSWLYDETKPFIHMEANETFAALRQELEGGYYEDLVRRYLLENPHRTVVILSPQKGLTARKEAELHQKLQEYKASLSSAEVDRIVEQTKQLELYQEEPSSKEALEKIPLLTREDIRKEAENFVNEERYADDTLILFHPVFTNGIGYLRFIFDISQISEELFPYIGVLKNMLGMVDTENYAYGDLFHETNISTGGISIVANTYMNSLNLSEYKTTLEVKVKVLHKNLEEAFRLTEEIILRSQFDDRKRLYEILAEAQSRMQASMSSAGHSLAAVRALAGISPIAAVSEQISGLPQYRLMERLESCFEEEKEDLVQKLELLVASIFRPENMMVDYTAGEAEYEGLEELVKAFRQKLFTTPVEKQEFHPQYQIRKEGYLTSAQVQYVCRAGNFVQRGLTYTGALKVLKVMMGYDYLWNRIRVKGGAYGCMCSFGRSGDSYFVSYRDPNLEKTLEVYENAADYIAAFDADERTVTQFIIGAISEQDVPMTPSVKGAYSLAGYMTKLSFEKVQQERDELLAVTQETIRGLADHVRAFLEEGCLCVVGNEEKIKENEELFERVEQLFH